MCRKCGIALVAFVAVLFLPEAAHGQCSWLTCVSHIEYDPVTFEVAGYSRATDYGYGAEIETDASLYGPEGVLYSDYDVDYDEATVYLYANPDESGGYDVTGTYYYAMEGFESWSESGWSYSDTVDTDLFPTGEYSTAVVSLTSDTYWVGAFNGNLLGNGNYNGHQIREDITDFDDGCYDMFGQERMRGPDSGDLIPVQAGNYYGLDYIGVPYWWITMYRYFALEGGGGGCSASFTQTLYDGSNPSYKTNHNSTQLDGVKLYPSRDGVPAPALWLP